MLIDTEAVRAAIDAEMARECDTIDRRYPEAKGTEPLTPAELARHEKAIKAFTRLEVEQERLEALLAEAETLVHVYLNPTEETAVMRATRELYQDLNHYANASERVAQEWLDIAARAESDETARHARNEAKREHREAHRVAEWSGRLRPILDALTGCKE